MERHRCEDRRRARCESLAECWIRLPLALVGKGRKLALVGNGFDWLDGLAGQGITLDVLDQRIGPSGEGLVLLDRHELAGHVPVDLRAARRAAFLLPNTVSALANTSVQIARAGLRHGSLHVSMQMCGGGSAADA